MMLSNRIKSDYDAIDVGRHDLQQLLAVVEQVMDIIDKKGGG